MIELAITVKDEERTLTKKFPVYQPLILSLHDEVLKSFINEVVMEFGGDLDNGAPDIIARTKMIIQ